MSLFINNSSQIGFRAGYIVGDGDVILMEDLIFVFGRQIAQQSSGLAVESFCTARMYLKLNSVINRGTRG